MNARQKAKHYKKLYEQSKKALEHTTQPIPPAMEEIFKRLLEKYEYAETQSYIPNSLTWALVKTCEEVRGIW
ncbi:MAG: hypothetical protein J6U54_17320 [Clostridiales bacterium]|nr:hypothetical protein [Clostridiales bacterium]